MDIVYDDLENYQDENVLSELRNENQELKCKLEEYASTLAHLQKDFDKLSIEYKKLELNYSSLLKTARAEIERKSQLITNLNLEKDKLVIESMQNIGRAPKRKLNGNGNSQQTGNQSGRDSAKEEHYVADPNSTAKSVSAPLLSQINNERKDKHDKKLSQGPTVKGDVEAKEQEQKSETSDHNRDRDKNESDYKKRKASNSDDLSNPTDRVSKIRNRRKSMPVLNRGDFNFSSDEDNDADRDNHIRRKTPLRDLSDRKQHETYGGRKYAERKVSESTRVGDRNESNYDSSRDDYRKSNSWYRDGDRYKSRDNRDKHELNQRSRRHHSPDRPRYNTQENYYNKHRESNDRPHRSDNVRQRSRDYNTQEDYYNKHRESNDRPHRSDNVRQRSRDSDRQRSDRFQHEQVHSIKHKIHDITEEPVCKRQRSELLSKQSDKHLQAKDVASRARSLSRSLEFSYLSLQSPDYLESNAPVQHIKEIMGTADTKLDDPRLTSKKYVISTHKDKGVLSTVVGRDVDIKVIDTTTWEMDKDKEIHKMPTPLREKPQISENLVKHIYMSIDAPISNLSLESGEICLEDEDICTMSENIDVVPITRQETVNTEVSTNKSVRDNDQSYDRTHVEKKEATCSKLFSKTYKIPKIKELNKPKHLEEDITNSTRNKLTKKGTTKQSHKKQTNKEKRKRDKKSQPEIPNYNPLQMFSDAINICKNKSNKFVDVNNRKHFTEEVMTSARDTVEGDLELSDETCDTDVADDFGYDKKSMVQSEEDSKNNVFVGINKKLNTELKKLENKEINVLKYGIETLSENRRFDIPLIGHADQCKESLSKAHNEDKSKNIKSKICDLFGETSSLITPEELGIAETPKENLNEYVPLFDNTQDAIDLNVEEMEKVQTRSMTLKCDESVLNHARLDVPLEKIEENVVKNPTDEEKQQFKNSIDRSSSSIQQMFENINAGPEPEDNRTVKTVIISTGMQNMCHSASAVHEEQEKLLSNIRSKGNESAPICPPLLNLTALATSTPHKEAQFEPSVSVPESSNTNNSKVVTMDTSNISSSDIQRNLDVPDLRIIVKRRRKPRGKTS